MHVGVSFVTLRMRNNCQSVNSGTVGFREGLIIGETIVEAYVPHESSSSPVVQSLYPLQTSSNLMHCPLSHVYIPGIHVVVAGSKRQCQFLVSF